MAQKKSTRKRKANSPQRSKSSSTKKRTLPEQSSSTKKRTNPVATAHFPIKQIHEFMVQNLPGKDVSPEAAIFLSAIIEYVAAELVELSVNASNSQASGSSAASRRVTASVIEAVIESDEELKQLMQNILQAQNGQ